MAGHSRLVCLTSLLTILLNAPAYATPSPLPLLNSTSASNGSINSLKPRVVPAPDLDGWIPFDSVGMMLPVKLAEESGDPSSPQCNTIECKQRMTYMNSRGGGAPLPPGLGLTKKDLPRRGSRDLVRRKAEIGLDDAGEPVYRLADYDDDDDEEGDDDDDEDEDGERDYDQEEEEYYEGNEDDENDENSLAKRHLPLLKGISVLGTPTFSRRSEGILASLFRRRRDKKKTSLKSIGQDKPRRKKNKTKLKQLNSLRKNKKGKGKLNVGGIDLMKGATILTTITWYTGVDLLNPFCDRKTKWTPTDDSMIVAVTEKWSLRPACGEFMEITTQDDKEPRTIIARVVDLCGGCIPEVPHADLSKAAFSKLYDLDVGRVHGLKMRRVGAPKRWSENLYGPKTL